MSRCLSESDLHGYHAGELDATTAARVRKHLDTCETCARRDAVLIDAHGARSEQLRRLQARETDVPSPNHIEDTSTATGFPGDGLDIHASKPPADVIGGYEITRELHRGGQGVVYQAIQKSTKRKVALKVMLEGPFASDQSKRRFEREIELVASMHHPSIVAIFDSGVSHGRYWYAMDYIRGRPLDQYVAGRSMSIDDTLRLFARVCEAVNYAHQHGVIHRDLKPGNILVDDRGEPHILDFGLAKVAGAEAVGDSRPMLVSVTGQVVGTLPYMSPEQARGDPERIDIRTDVYSLGVILYELLTGKYPYEVAGQMADVLRNIAEAAPRKPSTIRRQINNEVETIVLMALAKEPDRRYQSAGSLGEDVQRFLDGEPIAAKRDSSWYVLRKSLRRHRIPVSIVALFVFVVTGFTIGMTILSKEMRQARRGERQQQEELETGKAAQRELILEQCQEAILLLDSERLDRYLDKALESGVAPSIMHCYRGWAHALRFDFDEAWKELDEAVALDPENAEAYYMRAALHAKDDEAKKALVEFGKAQKFKRGTLLELTGDGVVKMFLRQYEPGLADLEELADRLRGQPAGALALSFGKWLRLLRDPPLDIEQRLARAKDALRGFDAAAEVRQDLPYVFDTRADLQFRIALMADTQGDARAAEFMRRRVREDSSHLITIGAAGAGDLHLVAFALDAGDSDAALRYARRAYEDLRRSDQHRSFHWKLALSTSIGFRLWCQYVQGDRQATRELLRLLGEEHVEFSRTFAFGVVHAATADRDEILGDHSALGDPSGPSYGFGLWVGARVRGDTRLAAHISKRCSVSMIERRDIPTLIDPLALINDNMWRRAFLAYMRETNTPDALLKAAGNDVHRVGQALLAIALSASSRARRIDGLHEVLKIAHPDRIWVCARGLLVRSERDPSFLNKTDDEPYENRTPQPVSQP